MSQERHNEVVAVERQADNPIVQCIPEANLRRLMTGFFDTAGALIAISP